MRWDFELPNASPGVLAYTPDGQKIVATGLQGDTRPRVFDLGSGGHVSVLDNLGGGQTGSVTIATALGRTLAIGFFSKIGSADAFVIWDLATGRIVRSNVSSHGVQSPEFRSQLTKLDANERIEAAHLTDDGRQIIALGLKSIFVFDAESLKLISQAVYRRDWIVSAPHMFYVLPDGSRAIVGVSESLVELVDVKTGRALAAFSGRFDYASQWAVSRDAQHFAAQSVDTNIHVWKIEDGAEEALLHGSSTLPRGLAFTPDGNTLAAWSRPTAFLWDIRPDRIRLAEPGGSWIVDAVDGKGQLALAHEAASAKHGAIWDLATHRLLTDVNLTNCADTSLRESRFSPSGDTLLLRCAILTAASQPRLTLIASSTGKVQGDISLPGAFTTQWSDDNHLISLTKEDYDEHGSSTFKIWDVAGNREILDFNQRGRQPRVHFASSARIVATTTDNAHLVVSMWDIATGSRLVEFERPGGDAMMVSDQRILVGGQNTRPELVSLPSGISLASIAGKATGASSVLLSKDGDHLLIQRNGYSSALWRISDKRLMAYLPSFEEAGYAAAFTDDGKRIVMRQWRPSSPRILVYETSTARLLKTIEGAAEYLDAYGGETGKRFVVQTGLGSIEIHDVEGDQPKRTLELSGRLYRWRLLANDERLVTADQSGVVAIWDVASGQKLRELPDAASGDPLSNSYPGSSRLAISMASGGIHVLDVSTGGTLMELDRSHSARIMALSPDGKYLALDQPRRIEICLIAESRCSASIPMETGSGLSSLAFSPGGNALLAEQKDGAAVLIDVGQARVTQSVRAPSKLRYDFSSGSCVAILHDRQLIVMNADSQTILGRMDYPKPIFDGFMGPSCKRVDIALSGGEIISYDVHKATSIPVVSLPTVPHGLRYAGSEIVIFEGDPFWAMGRVSLRDLAPGHGVTFLDCDWPTAGSGKWWTIHVDPTGRYMGVLTPDDQLLISHTRNQSAASSMIWGGKSLVDFHFSANGDTAVVVTSDGYITFWNSDKGGAQATLANLGTFAQYPPDTILLSADGAHMLAVDSSGNVVLLSLLARTARMFTSGKAEQGARAAMSADGALLATLSPLGVLRVWDVAIGQVLLEVPLETGSMTDQKVAFSEDGRRVIAESTYTSPTVLDLRFDGTRNETSNQEVTFSAQTPGAPRHRLGIVTGLQTNASPAPTKGIVVLDVLPDTPAMEAGVRLGDQIVAVNGERPTLPSDVARLVAKAGSNITLDLRRAERQLRVILVLR